MSDPLATLTALARREGGDAGVAWIRRAVGRSLAEGESPVGEARAILDGVVDRYRAGAMGRDDDFDLEGFAGQVASLAAAAVAMLKGDTDGIA